MRNESVIEFEDVPIFVENSGLLNEKCKPVVYLVYLVYFIQGV